MCDTFVAMPAVTGDGSVLFGKNSDRRPNEAQALEHHPPADHPAGAQVECTYLSLPQVRHTHGVLLSRPFWMWGAEMGISEKGVVIGNEAVFTRMRRDRGRGLLGMDLLRLALERAGSAAAALEIITDLLAEHGQGGLAGYRDKRMSYHNGYLIADRHEAWVLETAGELWAARRVEDSYSISNGLTIGAEYDEAHPELVDTAYRRGWLKRGEDFDFARCYSDWYYRTFTACRPRRARSIQLIGRQRGAFGPRQAFAVLRDHGTPEGYRPDRHLLMSRLCAHAANPLSRDAAQSTASLVAHLSPAGTTCWATGTSAPCTGVLKPIWLSGPVLPPLGPPAGALFDPRSLWWGHELLHRRVLESFPDRLGYLETPRAALESELLARSRSVQPGKRFALTEEAFSRAAEAEQEWLKGIESLPARHRPGPVYRFYWSAQNRGAGLKL